MKSYVTLEQKVCPVSGKTFDSDSLLMDMKLRDSFEKNTITGWEICPEVQEQLNKGFIALVEIDEDKSTLSSNGNYLPENVWRTGNICYLKQTACNKIFNMKITTPFVFIQQGVIEQLQIMTQ